MPEQSQSEVQETKFNLRTHHWDARGRLKSKSHYRLHIVNGAQYFERPVNSGNLFYENNEPAGRVEYHKDEKGRAHKKFDFEAEHKAYVAPLTGMEKIHFENESLKEQNAKLLAEIQAIKAEKDAKEAAERTAREHAEKLKSAEKSGQLAGTKPAQVSNLAQAVASPKSNPVKDSEL